MNCDHEVPYDDGEEGEYREETVPVKSLPANDWGLYEMHGNVSEWCQDWYGTYSERAVRNPKGGNSGSARVLRGGSWIYGGRVCRSAFRLNAVPGDRLLSIGFRLALGQ
ncbi:MULTISPECIES: formylglycine-generating enzyme family protein [unclassified Thiothrix]|uniref:formylglycine-generating enzyme family protein n=1 Tax=unclassified Thiothrix TaxID=2636184 RepID=UPI003454F358